jgi:hypothetical protein
VCGVGVARSCWISGALKKKETAEFGPRKKRSVVGGFHAESVTAGMAR